MATVVTVHGTFAHGAGTAEALNIGGAGEVQWWQNGSPFEADLKALVAGENEQLDVIPFTWSSDNSEIKRREAGTELLALLRKLDGKGEPYAVVGHSHGGSVISAALIESVARKQPLKHLSRWITVGTPFVGMRKERFLFTRLSLTRKVMFVASLMLLMMFLFYAVAEAWDARRFFNERYLTALLFSGAMMSLPMIFFYAVFRFLDNRELMGYSRGAVERAREAYADKWIPFCHKDDEAVQGLRLLPNVKLHFFENSFAESTLTKASIVALPLMYLLVVTSPTIMLAISDFLQSHVYDVQEVNRSEDDAVSRARNEMRDMQRKMRDAWHQAERGGLDAAAAEDARRRAAQLRNQLSERRRQIEQTLPQFAEVERAQRFKRRFLMRGREPCEGGRLCGAGYDYVLNSKLLFHVVTDELSSAVVNDDMFGGAMGGAVRLLVPVVLVPVAFALIALGVLAIIQYLASIVSVLISRVLNKVTFAEVKRSSFGNDTEGEIVLGADYRPSWLEPVTCFLPTEVSDAISDHSNAMASQSISKFRNAISTLAFSEGEDSKAGMISSYLSWKELVHTSYFDVPAFRKMVALALSQAPGFRPTDAFVQDGDYAQTTTWVASIGQRMEPKTHLAVAEEIVPPAAAA